MDFATRIEKDPKIKSRLVNQTARLLKKALRDQNEEQLNEIFFICSSKQFERKINNSFYSTFNFILNNIDNNFDIKKSQSKSNVNHLIHNTINSKASEIPGFYSRKELKVLRKKHKSKGTCNNNAGAKT